MALITHPSPLDTLEIAKRVQKWFDDRKFETRSFEGDGVYVVKARKSSRFRAIVAGDRAIEVVIRQLGGETQVNVTQGSWKTNIVSNAVWLVAVGAAMLLVSGWSIVIQKDLENYIRSVFEELGGVREVDLRQQ